MGALTTLKEMGILNREDTLVVFPEFSQECHSVKTGKPAYVTASAIAKELSQPVYRVLYAIKTRGIEPARRVA